MHVQSQIHRIVLAIEVQVSSRMFKTQLILLLFFQFLFSPVLSSGRTVLDFVKYLLETTVTKRYWKGHLVAMVQLLQTCNKSTMLKCPIHSMHIMPRKQLSKKLRRIKLGIRNMDRVIISLKMKEIMVTRIIIIKVAMTIIKDINSIEHYSDGCNPFHNFQ